MVDNLDEFDREVRAFQSRLRELTTERSLALTDDPIVAAAFLELDAAAEELRVAHEELSIRGPELTQRQLSADRERQLMRAVFRDMPLPVVLLDRDARIRRVNEAANRLLAATPDFTSGKPFGVFLDLPVRATFRSQLAAVVRGLGQRSLATTLLVNGAPSSVRLSLSLIPVPADSRPLILALFLPLADDAEQPASGGVDPLAQVEHDGGAAVRLMTRHMDLLAALARLLLEERGRGETASLQAAAQLLCAELVDWLVIDLVREPAAGQGLQRAVVCGPPDPQSQRTAQELEQRPVDGSEIPGAAISSQAPILHTHLENHAALSDDARGVPFLNRMRAHSLLCLPLLAGGRTIGALTAVRSTGRPALSLADQSGLQRMADLLALAVHTDRQRRQEDVAGAVRRTLAPRVLHSPPGMELASQFRTGSQTVGLGGDFFDVCQSPSGWSILLGDAAGDGEEASVQAALARHVLRLFSLDSDDPAAVLVRADDAVRRLPDSDRQIRVAIAALHPEADTLRVTLCSAGHLSSMIIRADGRVRRFDGGGLPLSGPAPLHVHEDATVLEQGDCLVLYSDGVLAATDGAGGMFEQSGALARTLAHAHGQSAEEIVAALDAGLLQHAAPELTDDALIVVVKPSHAAA